MSNGSQIGGLIGAGIGLWVSGGNPQAGQLGYAIGPVIGGSRDLEHATQFECNDEESFLEPA